MDLAEKRIKLCIEKKEIELNICDLNLKELPKDLSQSLKILDCYNNQLKELPKNLPPSLQKLYCSNNQLKELPKDLPPSLQTLNCRKNKYLYINKEIAQRFKLKETPNYNKCAEIIQN